MKKDVLRIVAVLLVACSLSACGGGGGGSAAPATPVGTEVDLSELKGFMEARASAGSEAGFTVAGSSSAGAELTGTVLMTISNPTVTATPAGNQTVNVVKRQIKLHNAATSTTGSSVSTFYCYQTGRLFKIVHDSGITSSPAAQTLLPSSAKVGDVGDDKEINNTDGSSEKSTWTIAPGTNGDARFVYSFTNRNKSNIVTSTSEDTYTITPDGRISALATSIFFPQSGITVEFSGNRD